MGIGKLVLSYLLLLGSILVAVLVSTAGTMARGAHNVLLNFELCAVSQVFSPYAGFDAFEILTSPLPRVFSLLLPSSPTSPPPSSSPLSPRSPPQPAPPPPPPPRHRHGRRHEHRHPHRGQRRLLLGAFVFLFLINLGADIG